MGSACSSNKELTPGTSIVPGEGCEKGANKTTFTVPSRRQSHRHADKAGKQKKEAGSLQTQQLSTHEETLDIFLCGMTGSGKSTMARQLMLRWGQGLSDDERARLRFMIRKNMVDWVNKAVQTVQNEDVANPNSFYMQSTKKGNPLDDGALTTLRYSLLDLEDIESAWWEIALAENASDFDKRYWENIARIITSLENIRPFSKKAPLLDDPAITLLYSSLQRYMVHLKVDTRIFQDSFNLDFEDVMHAMAPTKEFEKRYFGHNGQNFCLCDVSGQRHHTQSWQLWRSKRTCAVIYVVNLMDYILTDSKDCRLVTNRKIFKELLMTLGKPTKVVLIMNKFDIFKDNLALQPLNLCPSFTNEPEACRRENENDHIYANRCKHLISQMFVLAFDEVVEKRQWGLKAKEKSEFFSYHSSCAIDRSFVQNAMDQIMTDVARHHQMMKARKQENKISLRVFR